MRECRARSRRGRLLAECERAAGDLGIDRRHRIVLGAFLDGERRKLVGDLRPPALGRFRRLLQLQQLELEVVAAALLRRQRHAFAVIFLLPRLELVLGGVARARARHVSPRAPRDRMVELGELALPRQHAVQLAVGREEADAPAR